MVMGGGTVPSGVRVEGTVPLGGEYYPINLGSKCKWNLHLLLEMTGDEIF